MNILLSLAIMLLPFSAFLLVIGHRALRNANKDGLPLMDSNRMATPSGGFEVAQPSLDPIHMPPYSPSNFAVAQLLAGTQTSIADIGEGDTINLTLTQDQLEVIADALELTGECIEKNLIDTTDGSEVHGLLIEDRRNISATMNVVSGALEACPS
jgi:hypothetical protein